MKTSRISSDSQSADLMDSVLDCLDDPLVQFVVAFRNAEKALRKQEGCIIRKYQLTPTQFAVLHVLYSNPGSNIQFVLDHALTTSGNIGTVLSNLQKRDLIEKSPDPDDRRNQRLSLTEKGMNLFEQIFPEHTANLHRLFSKADLESLSSLTDWLLELRESLESVEDEV